MWRTSRAVLALLAVAVLTAACAVLRTSAPPTAASLPQVDDVGLAKVTVDRLEVDPADATRAAEAINAVGLDILRRTEPGANAVFSPASIVLALGMARPGARGATAAEMDAVLRDIATDEHAGWLGSLEALLTDQPTERADVPEGVIPKGRAKGDVKYALRIVNATFAQADFPWEPAYLEALAARFDSGLRLVDYVREPDAARRLINDWVSDETEERIPELLPADTINNATRLTLVNAIYLKAPWSRPFAGATGGLFHRLDGSPTTVSMMRGGRPGSLAEGDGWLAVELPYKGGQLAMTIIVPDDLATFETELGAARLQEIVSSLEPAHVDLSMPRFGIETKVDLVETLSTMGMPTAFSWGADFSGMTDADQLFISHVIHQASIDVDEKGTEAAAATAVGAEVVSMPRPVVVDRPFLFALRDIETGAMLFLGRVVEPAERA